MTNELWLCTRIPSLLVSVNSCAWVHMTQNRCNVFDFQTAIRRECIPFFCSKESTCCFLLMVCLTSRCGIVFTPVPTRVRANHSYKGSCGQRQQWLPPGHPYGVRVKLNMEGKKHAGFTLRISWPWLGAGEEYAITAWLRTAHPSWPWTFWLCFPFPPQGECRKAPCKGKENCSKEFWSC